MLEFFVRHGMIVDKFHEIISFKQSKWLENYIKFNTRKQNIAKTEFEKDFYKLLNNAFYGKTMEYVRNRRKVEFIEKDDTDIFKKQESKLSFKGIHKSYENFDSYSFKQKEVLMIKSNYLGFSILELSKFLLYELYYDDLQPFFGKKKLQLHYLDTDSFLLFVNTKDIIKDLKSLEDLFDFSTLNENHELFNNENKKKYWQI